MKINLRVLSIAVAVAIGVLGAVQLANPADLGLSPVAARWLSIVATGLGVLASFLPRVTGPTTDPDELADRIMGLDHEKRLKVLDGLAARGLAHPSAIDPTTPAGRTALDDEREGHS